MREKRKKKRRRKKKKKKKKKKKRERERERETAALFFPWGSSHTHTLQPRKVGKPATDGQKMPRGQP